MKHLLRLLALAICWTWGTGDAQACSCVPSSPEAGFDRAQYVFTGKVVKAEHHVWLVDVERVWKGHEKLRHTIKLMDVYARMDCEFFFELGQRYLFFTILAKGGRDVFYHPQACNWTRRLAIDARPRPRERVSMARGLDHSATWPGRTTPRCVGSLTVTA